MCSSSNCKVRESVPYRTLLCNVKTIFCVVYFVWGVVQYVIASDEEAKKTGRNRMIYGIIGLVVIVSMWGLVGIVRQTFGLDSAVVPPNITTPCVPGTLGCN
jgi:ABC-type thiamin/hydroxymethylpyrimidine transport system permease subunit